MPRETDCGLMTFPPTGNVRTTFCSGVFRETPGVSPLNSSTIIERFTAVPHSETVGAGAGGAAGAATGGLPAGGVAVGLARGARLTKDFQSHGTSLAKGEL